MAIGSTTSVSAVSCAKTGSALLCGCSNCRTSSKSSLFPLSSILCLILILYGDSSAVWIAPSIARAGPGGLPHLLHTLLHRIACLSSQNQASAGTRRLRTTTHQVSLGSLHVLRSLIGDRRRRLCAAAERHEARLHRIRVHQGLLYSAFRSSFSVYPHRWRRVLPLGESWT